MYTKKAFRAAAFVSIVLIMAFRGMNAAAVQNPGTQSPKAHESSVQSQKLQSVVTVENGRTTVEDRKVPGTEEKAFAKAEQMYSVALSLSDSQHSMKINDHMQFYREADNGNQYSYSMNDDCSSDASMVESTAGGWLIHYNNLKFGTDGKAYIELSTSAGVFLKIIDAASDGASIPVAIDSTFVPLNVNISYSSSASIQGLQVNYNDGNGKGFFLGYVPPGAKVAAGTYDIQAMATDSKYGYYLTKKDYQLTSATGTLSFDKGDATLVNIVNKDKSADNSYFYTSTDRSYYQRIALDNKKLPVYVSKGNYLDLDEGLYFQNKYKYRYTMGDDGNLFQVSTDSMDFNTGTALSLKYSPSSYLVYPKAAYFSDIGIVDEYGNDVSVNDTSGAAMVTVTLTDAGGVVTTYSGSAAGDISLILPDQTGEFTLNCTESGGLYPIAPLASTKIKLADTPIYNYPLAQVTNLRTTGIFSNEVDLTWDYYSSGTMFRVYRSEAGGAFKRLATTLSRQYYDMTAKPNTSYAYYVVGYNGYTEGPHASSVNASTIAGVPSAGQITVTVKDTLSNLNCYDLSNDIILNARRQNSSNNRFETLYTTPCIVQTGDGTGWDIILKDIDFTNYRDHRLSIQTDQNLYIQNLNVSYLNTHITEIPSAAAAKFSISIPSSSDFTMHQLKIVGVEPDGSVVYYGTTSRMINLPPQKYDFTVTGMDDEHVYNLSKQNVAFSAANSVLQFNPQELSQVNYSIHNTTSMNFKASSISTDYDGTGILLYESLYWDSKQYSSVYVSKGTAQQIKYGVSDNTYEIFYSTGKPVTIDKDSLLMTCDTSFKVVFTPSSDTFYINNRFGDLNVMDNSGNYVNIYGVDDPVGTCILTDANGGTTTLKTSNPWVAWFIAPSTPGMYKLSYSVNAGAFNIAPLTNATIVIDKTNTLGINIFNLAVANAANPSSQSVNLTWGASYPGDYEVFRASSENGVYTKVATTVSMNYMDVGLQPSSHYWYKVRAVSEDQNGAFSDTVSAATIASSAGDIDPHVDFMIPDSTHSMNGSSIQSSLYDKDKDSNAYISNKDTASCIIKTDSGWTVRISCNSGRTTGKEKMVLKTDQAIYIKDIDYLMLGKAYQLDASSQSPVTVNIPYKSGELKDLYLAIRYEETDGSNIFIGFVHSGILLPEGCYSFNVTCSDDKADYQLEKISYAFSKNTAEISFQRADARLIQYQMINTSGTAIHLEQITATYKNMNVSGITGTSGSCYINKDDLDFLYLYYYSNNGTTLSYSIDSQALTGGDQALTLDTNLNAVSIVPDGATVEPGSQLWFTVNDGHGNNLFGEHDDANSLTGTVTLTAMDNTVLLTSSFTGYNALRSSIFLPVYEGVVGISYTITGTQIPITPLSMHVTISRNAVTLPGNPVDLQCAKNVAGSWILTWDNELYATSYRIYRVNNDGSKTAIGTSSVNSFSLGTPAAGTYQYLVVASNSAGDGGSSDILTVVIPAALILGDLNNDSKVDITDYNLLKSCVLGKATPASGGFTLIQADIDKDGVLTSRDVAMMRKMITLQK